MVSLTVSMAIRPSDIAPNASEAATAWVKEIEATGAGRLTKPAAPGDRIMVKFLHDAGESPATATSIAGALGKIGAPAAPIVAKSRRH